jgi:hypothetical protein
MRETAICLKNKFLGELKVSYNLSAQRPGAKRKVPTSQSQPISANLASEPMR